MTRDRTRRRAIGLLGAAGAAAILALGAAPALTASAASVHRGPVPTAGHRHVTASEADNGRTITVRRGGSLALTLHSTYWTIAGSSNPAVLRELLTPTTHPRPAHCVPGQGCGTVSASFVAVASGKADVTASRTTCGEAMRCTPAQGDFVLHVVVTG